MSTIIRKSITNDFPNGQFSIKQFTRQLQNTINSNNFVIDNKGDTVTITFAQVISETIVNSLISSFKIDHSYDITGTEPLIIYPSPENRIFFKNWGLLHTFLFPGTLQVGLPTNVVLFACISPLAGSGSVRLYDATNQKEIVSFETIQSTVPMKYIMTISNNENWPRNEAMLEIHAKRSSLRVSEFITCNSLTINW